MNKQFIFNNHNVCLNPDLYNQWGEGIDSWIITLAEHDGTWDYGYRTSGGCSMGSSVPCMKKGKYKTKQEAINSAVETLKENANLCLRTPTNINNSQEHKKFAKEFLDWYNSNVLQPTLF